MAAELTWQGDLGANWNAGTVGTDTNWSTATLPATSGDSLVFNLATAQELATFNNFSGLSVESLTIVNDGTNNGFTLSGNAITLNGNITVNGTTGSHLHEIALDLILSDTREFVVSNNNVLLISGVISGEGFSLLKGSPGVLSLTGANTFTGNAVLRNGTIRINTLNDSGVASSLGAGSLISFGFASNTGILEYEGAGDSTNRQIELTAGGGTIRNNGTGALVFTASNFNNAATSNPARVLTLGGSNTAANTVQGTISNNAGSTQSNGVISLVKADAGTWVLEGLNNTFSGSTTISSGILRIYSLANVGDASSLGTGASGSSILFGNNTGTGTLDYLGAGSSTDRQIQIGRGANANHTGGAALLSNGAGALIFSASAFNSAETTNSNTRTLTLGGSNTAANTIQGVIANNADSDASSGGDASVALLKTDSGTWVLTGVNTYSGGTTIRAGTLQVNSLANTGTASSLGTGTIASVILIGNGSGTGTIEYTGTGSTTDRQIQIGSGANANHIGGATILNNGSGALVFSAENFIVAQATNSNARALTLGGSHTGANTIRGVIANNTDSSPGNGGDASIRVVKQDAGTWLLTGLNTYTGTTEIQGGVLQVGLNGEGTTGTGNTSIRTGGTLGGTGIVQGNLTLEGGFWRPGDLAGEGVGTQSVLGNTTFTSGSIYLQALDSQLNVEELRDSTAAGYEAALSTLTTNYSAALAAQITSGDYDHLEISGLFTWGGASRVYVEALAGHTLQAGDVLNFLDWTSVSNAAAFNSGDQLRLGGETDSSLFLQALGSGLWWDTSLFATHGILVVTSSAAVVPEPSRMLLILAGVSWLVSRRRRLVR